MKVKEAKNKASIKTITSKTKYPQVKIDGFHNAIKNTDMLEVVEQINKEKITKP